MVETATTRECDVLVIGAGGAGMRAAIAAAEAGASTIVVSKSLLGKAHTVMAEGGIAAGHWQAAVGGPRSVTAGLGWEHEVPFGHDHPPGSLVTAHVDNLLAFDGEFWRACSAQSA